MGIAGGSQRQAVSITIFFLLKIPVFNQKILILPAFLFR